MKYHISFAQIFSAPRMPALTGLCLVSLLAINFNAKAQSVYIAQQRTQHQTTDSTISKTERAVAEPPSPAGRFLSQHFGVELQFSNIYEDNIDHDSELESIPSYGMVPSLQLQIRSSASNPLFTLDYLVARHSYSNTERWDRISNAFRGVFKPRISDSFSSSSSIEVSLKGSSEDRDISNQFQVVQEFEYSFTRRHHLQVYGTYRMKRFPGIEDSQTFKPNVGVNFERSNSDGERFESGARYEFNKRNDPGGNYKRWTFSVAYRSPEFNERDQFEIGIKHRRKFYTQRLIEIEDEDYLRQDNRMSIDAVWAHQFKGGVTLELGYEYETRSSNDPDKLYEANAFSLVMIYEL